MKISTLYDAHLKISNSVISAFIYKIFKLYVNLLYPLTIQCENGLDSSSDVIVSLTSFPERISSVWITIATLLKQTVKPKKIILWLAKDQFPNGEFDLPQKLLNMKKYGLTIRFCDNLYPHKKYFYAMQENPDMKIVTVDDDVFYPEYLIDELQKVSKRYPNAVCCTWAHEILVDENSKIIPYNAWKHGIQEMGVPRLSVMPVGIGGVLYPPNCLDKRVFDKEKIMKLCLREDDLWLKSMAILKQTPAVRINKSYKRTFFTQIGTQHIGLRYENIGKNKNDEVLKMISKEFQIEKMIKNIGGGGAKHKLGIFHYAFLKKGL